MGLVSARERERERERERDRQMESKEIHESRCTGEREAFYMDDWYGCL